MKQPECTVILPVHNAADYLEAALASLAAQSCRGFVLHVWDDGSTDATPDILNQWIPRRLPGQVVGRDAIGIGPALARLVESAPTPLIARMDGDDLCHPKRLERQLAFMRDNPDTAVLGTQMQRRDAALTTSRGDSTHPLDDRELRWAMKLANPLNHPTIMMRRAAVLASGNYRDLRPGQDDDLWLRMAQRYRFANLPDRLLTYREHTRSTTGQHFENAVSRFRERRLAAASCVFPGLADDDAKRLTLLLTQTHRLDILRSDIDLLYFAAEQAAIRSGEPSDYFQHTAQFREQLANFRIRRLKANPIARRAWPMLRCLAKITNKRHRSLPRVKAA